MKKRIPTGVVNFNELQTSNYYTVDKTKMIQDFIERGSKVTLITRPRRFGKTSNMSMMSEFFDITKDSNKIFLNTLISQTEYINEMNKYPVIFLSFANCKGEYNAMKKLLFEALRAEYAKHRKLFEQNNVDLDLLEQVRGNYKALCEANDLVSINTSIKILSQFLHASYGKRVIIFIDEYDTPFIEAHVQDYYQKMSGVLSSLLHSALKDNDYLQYAMLTGIQRVAKENIFSDLNNLDVFTVKDKEYAPYFGFTEEETKTLLEYYDISYTAEIKRMYDGYNMGGIDIYNPWSIINYAKRQELIPYWVNTSSNSMIKQAMNQSDQYFKNGYERLIKQGFLDTQVSLDTSFYEESGTNSLWGLFVNAGYLTIAKVIDAQEDEYRLRIPNHEVLREFKILTATHLNVEPKFLSDLYKGLRDRNAQIFITAYREILMMNPSYHDLRNENSYHMFMLGICLYIRDDYVVTSNREVGQGRCDIILKANKQSMASYVIEFKHTKEKEKLAYIAKQAIDQIKVQQYDTELNEEVIYIGLAHSGKEVAMEWVLKK